MSLSTENCPPFNCCITLNAEKSKTACNVKMVKYCLKLETLIFFELTRIRSFFWHFEMFECWKIDLHGVLRICGSGPRKNESDFGRQPIVTQLKNGSEKDLCEIWKGFVTSCVKSACEQMSGPTRVKKRENCKYMWNPTSCGELCKLPCFR